MEPSRANFCHPYQPYDIQLEFMQELYRCIEDGGIGIFESPTGTGKSLSLICGALTWLRDDSRRAIDRAFQDSSEDESDWLVAADNANRRREFLREREEFERELAALRAKEDAQRRRQIERQPQKKPKLTTPPTASGNVNIEEFVLDDYDGDRDVQPERTNLSASTQALLDQLKPPLRTDEAKEDDRTKIIFCSRTHSQLTQFIHELRRVKPPPGLPSSTKDDSESDVTDHVKELPLGSRKNLCINHDVLRLGSTSLINERCTDLQKPSTLQAQRCPFLPTKENQYLVGNFRARAVATIRDIEDLADLGREMKTCPYYAARSAIAQSEILTLPYPLLLQKTAREALGVSVKGNIVIIDEAHNLMDAIADTLSVSMSLKQIDMAVKQVTFYAQRFKARLKGANRMYVAQFLRLLNSFSDCLRAAVERVDRDDVAISAAQLMSGKGVDQIQPHRLLEYLRTSKLIYKVEGYTEAHEDNPPNERSRGTLMQIQSFLAVLMNPDSEGRFFVSGQQQDVAIKYTLLDPRQHFRDIVEDARAVILAGGTMSPMSDYAEYLFSYVVRERLRTFSFGHVIPRTNLLAESLARGPTGIEFDFTFERRGSESMIVELGAALCRVCRRTPDGVVVFFPSYDYLARVVSTWKRSPSNRPLFDDLIAIKPIFEESKIAAVDELLRDYRAAIDESRGGLMLSVVGGKLSEGINFSDRLGRAVVAVGLPFPNIHGAEWKAKLDHIKQMQFAHGQDKGLTNHECKRMAESAGQEFYENACMRAVNQSIGRAIRHRNDYAAILLVDRRFASERIRKKLPQWIVSSMSQGLVTSKWDAIEAALQGFFGGRH